MIGPISPSRSSLSEAAWGRMLVLALTLFVAVFVGATAGLGRLNLGAAAAVGLAALALSIRWPLLPLFAFVVFIPLEDFLRFGDLGTVTKVAGALFAVAYGVPRLSRLRWRAMPLAGWGYAFWATLSMAWAIDPEPAWLALTTLLQMFAVTVLIADVVAARPALVRPMLWAYSASAALISVLAIAAYAMNGLSLGDRVAAVQDQNVAQFAAILLPALIFTTYEALKGRLVVISASVAFLSSIAIILSGTRGVWLALVVVFAAFILPAMRPVQRVAACVFAVLILAVAFQLPSVANLITSRTEIAVETGGAGRTDIWAVGLVIIETSPVVGVGYGDFPAGFTHEAIFDSTIGPLAHPGLGRGRHSIVVGTLGELGIVGLLLLVAFLVPLVVRRGHGPEAAAVQAALVGLLVSALFLDELGRKQLWLMIGIALRPRLPCSAGCVAARADPGSRMTRVVWLTSTYPWADEPMGGIFFATQARALASLGAEVDLVAPTPWAPQILGRVRDKWRSYALAPSHAQDQGVRVSPDPGT